jgi:formylglycine-generating enzyme required for sulfatase activity
MEYLDFEIAIDAGFGGEYRVSVLRSPGGETRETTRFPFDQQQLESRLGALQATLIQARGARDVVVTPPEAAESGQQAAREFGRVLFEVLFEGEVGSLYVESLREARRKPDRGLRIKLRTQAPELAVLPWEFLHDPKRDDFLCLSNTTPLIRYLESPNPPEALAVTPPLRILGMIASPTGLPALDVAREKARIEEALADSRQGGLVDLTWLQGQSWEALQRAMGRGGGGPWHIFHFIGHGGFNPGTNEGHLALATEQGERYDLTASGLSRLLQDHQTLRLCVLNACEGSKGSGADLFSSTAATLVRRGGLPAVVSMQQEISDRAAIEFAREFYRSLADGSPVDAAVAEARKAVSLALPHSVEWGTPVLHMRSPDGNLFRVVGRPSAGTPQLPPQPPARPVSEEQKRRWQGWTRRGAKVAFGFVEETLHRHRVAAAVLGVALGLGLWWFVNPIPRLTQPVQDSVKAAQHAMDSAAAAQRIRDSIATAQRVRDSIATAGRVRDSVAAATRTRDSTAAARRFGLEHFALIPAGSFQMGSANGKPNERRHPVTISRPFWLQKTEVTQVQWQSVMGSNPSKFQGCPRCPVEQVSWDDIQGFLARLNKRGVGRFRLPTEAEWEYAARAGTTGDYGGTGRLEDMGWYRDNGGGRTHEVAQGKQPNAWGLYDMHGNVWEWVNDRYDAGYYERSSAADPPGPALGQYRDRVLRGGAWNSYGSVCRSAFRGSNKASFRDGDSGFRLVRIE